VAERTVPHYDVIVVGAGSVGAPAAFSLAGAGVRPLVIDRLPSVGQGSNKTAIGGIRATHSDPAKIRISLRSIDIYATWKERYGDEIEWYRGGYSFVAYREREERILKDLLAIQQAYGLNIHWLDKDALLEVIPALNPNGLIGGTHSPDDGNASPLLAIHGEQDELIPFAEGRALFEAAPEPKAWYPIPGAGHNDTYIVGGKSYFRKIRSFLDQEKFSLVRIPQS